MTNVTQHILWFPLFAFSLFTGQVAATEGRPLVPSGRYPIFALIATQERPPEMDPSRGVDRIDNEQKAKRMAEGLPEYPTGEEQRDRIESVRTGIPYETLRRNRVLTALAEKADIPYLIRKNLLSEMIRHPGFQYFPNAMALANAYAMTFRQYEIRGLRLDGNIDSIFLSGRSLLLSFQGNYLAALGGESREYERLRVEFKPDNSSLVSYLMTVDDLPAWRRLLNPLNGIGTAGGSKQIELVADGNNWRQVTANNERLNLSPSAVGLRTLTVKKMRDGTQVAIYPGTNAGGTITWFITEGDADATHGIANFIKQSSVIVHAGDDLPQDWLHALFASNGGSYTRKSDRSPNVSTEDMGIAASLGARSLSRSNTKLFNALPQEGGLASSLAELWRMGLDLGRRHDWQDLSADVKLTANALGLQVDSVTKADVLQELSVGQSDVVFLIAHSSSGVLYLPGKGGESISRNDLDRIKRDATPNRIVVLITCKGGTVNADTTSLAEAVLENRLARSVFASPLDVDARNVPQLLRDLMSARAIRDTLHNRGFIQIVYDSIMLLQRLEG
jgi:hypothetical protein